MSTQQVNSAFVKAYEQGEALSDGTDPILPYAPHEGPLSIETQATKKAAKNKKTLDAYNRPTSREALQQARAAQQAYALSLMNRCSLLLHLLLLSNNKKQVILL